LNTNPKRKRVNISSWDAVDSLALWAGKPETNKRHFIGLNCLVSVVFFLLCIPASLYGQIIAGQSADSWATDKEFQRSRHRPFSVSWQAAPIRDRIGQLAQQQKISVFLDRRIDPRTELNLTASNVTMEQVLLQVCDQKELGFSRLGDCLYIGPKHAAEALLISTATSSTTKRKLDTALLKKGTLSWPNLTTPQEALEQLAAEADVELKDTDLLPHDMMSAVSTVSLTLEQRIRLLLIQFDLGYEFTKRRGTATLTVRPAKELPATGSLRFSDADLSLAQYQTIKAKASGSRMRRSKKTVTVTGPVKELLMVRDFIIRSFSPLAPKSGDQRFTLKVTSRRSAILTAIGNQLLMPVDTFQADPEAMSKVVDLSVKDVSLQELLDQIMAGSGATCVVKNGKIVVGQD